MMAALHSSAKLPNDTRYSTPLENTTRIRQNQTRMTSRPPLSFSMLPLQIFSLWLVLCLSILSTQCSVHAQDQATTCDFGTGVIFQAEEALGDMFTTLCGNSTEFPCFCRPGLNPPVDCPYCGIATPSDGSSGLDGSTTGLVCARVGGPSVTVITLDAGLEQECICQRDVLTGSLESVCVDPGQNVPVEPSPPDVCTLEWEDGSVDVFQDGDSYGELFSTRCGAPSVYPCFCDVSLPDKINCPYCGVANNVGGVVCGQINEAFSLTNEQNEDVTCQCEADLESICTPTSSVTTPRPAIDLTRRPTTTPTRSPSLRPTTSAPVPTPAPIPGMTPSPTVRPTPAPVLVTSPATTAPAMVLAPASGPSTLPPFFSGTFPPNPPITPTAVTPPTPTPTIAPSPSPTMIVDNRPQLPTFDKPTILAPSRTPPVVVPGCPYEDPTQVNGLGFVVQGDALESDLLKGPCAPYDTYPALCNPQLPGSVEYPYCVFTTSSTTTASSSQQQNDNFDDDFVVCAKSGDRVSVPTAVGTIETCSCLYLNPFIGAVSSCPDLLVSVPLALTMSPSAVPTEFPSLSPPPPTAEPTAEPTATSERLNTKTDSGSSVHPSGLWMTLLLSMLVVPAILRCRITPGST